MAVATRSLNPKGALEHIITVILVYDSYVREALTSLGASDIHDFMDLDTNDLKLPFTCPDKDDASTIITISLQTITIKKLISLQLWYAEQTTSDFSAWFGLTADAFNIWRTQQNLARVIPIAPVLPTSTTPLHSSPSTREFRQHIKINVSDYVKLKEDQQWRSFHRQLMATAANHDTLDVLNPSYQPSPELVAVFEQKQRFMYNVFIQCINTSKGKVCVRSHESTMDAQLVYKELFAVYNDDLSVSLDASTLRAELTVMKLDDKWRKGFETFLTHWSSKVQELESIEDKSIDDSTKRIWLTNTLLGQKDMDDAVRQAITTELTMSGMNGTSLTQVSWHNFYRIVLSTAKMLDKSKKDKSNAQRQNHHTEHGRPNNNGQGNHGSSNQRGFTPRSGPNKNNNAPRTYTTYTGPSMAMTASMFFSKSDWPKLTKDQRTKFLELRKKARDNKGTPTPRPQPSFQANATQVAAGPPAAPSPTVAVPVPASGANIRHLLSNSAARDANTSGAANHDPPPAQLSFGGRTYTLSTCKVHYSLQKHVSSSSGSLIDGGANGGMSGSDVRVLAQGFGVADVSGIADKSVTNLPLSTVAGLIETHKGPIIGIFHQYAHYGQGKTVHSVNQLKHFGLTIDDTPKGLGLGQQCIKTPDGYIIPLSIRNGLPFMDMSPPTDTEIDGYPHVFFTSDLPWDPTILDNEFNASEIELLEDDDLSPSYHHNSLNDYGELIKYQLDNHNTVTHSSNIDACIYHVHYTSLHQRFVMNRHIVQPKQHDFNRLKPHFGFVPVGRIQHTIANTSQFARMDTRLPLRKHFKSRFPAANISRLNDTVATDTFFSDVPAHDDGIMGHGGTTMLQLYCGCKSLLTAGYSMKTGDEMASTFENFIRQHGAPNALFSDNAKAQIGRAVHEILRMYAIKDFQCEPHHQHQNSAERRIQEVKKMSNQLMDRTNTPPNLWLLCVNYVIYILNRLSTESIDWKTPIEAATGQQPDISAILAFRWFEPVYFKPPSHAFPSESLERTGRVVGVAEHQGDTLTFLVLDDLSTKVLARSELRSALDLDNPNLRAEHQSSHGNFHSDGGESNPAIKPIMSSTDIADLHVNPSDLKLPKFLPEDLLGLTFLREMDDGKAYRAKIVRQIIDNEAANHKKIKFLVEIGEGQFDEILTYNMLSDIVEQQQEREEEDPDNKVWTFVSIKDHQGPLKNSHPDYKGSTFNVLIHWEDGSETYEPLDVMIKDDPVSLAKYAEENDLLDTPGWKRLKSITSNKTKLNRMLHQAKQKKGPVYQFGIQVPRNVKEAYALDSKNGNTKWGDAMKSEIDSLNEFNTFKDHGKVPYVDGFKRIVVHFVFAVKHDLRHKARLVAGGHLTNPTTEGSYSGVVSLRSLRIALVSAELNDLQVMVGDVSSAYLEAYTQEKVCFIAGPEFGSLEGHLLVIERALYGLRSSGARWHDRFADTLRDMGYSPCRADPDVWLKDCDTHYEYVCVYVDDLMAIGKNPKEFFNTLTEKHQYQLKGVGPPTYHLGGDFFRDRDGTLAWGTSSYVKKMLINYEHMFGEKPKEYSSPMLEKDHPELDLTPELDETGIKQYQSLIGALQWLVTLGRFDIQIGVATMGSYRVAPRIGHLDRLKRMYGYIKRHPDGAVRFRVRIPDHESQGTPVKYDWSQAVYGDIKEELPYHQRARFVHKHIQCK